MFTRNFSCSVLLRILLANLPFRLRDSHPLRYAFPCVSTIACCAVYSPYPGCITASGLASSHFARRYFGNLNWFLFLRLLRCFSSAGFPPIRLYIQRMVLEYCSSGLPHSDIHVSSPICGFSWLFAACRVLLRLLMPRHSPCALFNLTFHPLGCFLSDLLLY